MIEPDIMQTCEFHLDQDPRYYCQSHEMTCCEVCKTTNHKLCQDVVEITDMDCDILYQDIQQKLQKYLEGLSPLSDLIARNMSGLERQKVVFKNTITCYKRKVKDHLEKLEADILREYDSIFQGELLNLEKLKEELVSKRLQAESCLISLREESLNNSDMSNYVSLRGTFRKFEKEDDYIQNFHNSEVYIDFTMTKEIMMFENLSSLGTIEVKRYLHKHVREENEFKETCENGIENSHDTSPFSSNINSESMKILFESEAEIIDLKKLDEENLIMTDRNGGKVLLFCLKDKSITELLSCERPDCLAIVDRYIVALIQGRRYVMLMNTRNKTVLKKIDMQDSTEGLTIIQNKLIVNCATIGLQILDMSGKTMSSIPGITGRLYLHTTRTHQIICADQENNTVTCITIDGDVIFSFSDDRLISPYGLTTDEEDNIFVLGIDSQNLFKISRDGRDARQILTSNNGLKRPYVIFFMNDHSILISNDNGHSVVRYKV